MGSEESKEIQKYDQDFELIWNIYVDTYKLKPFADILTPDEIAKFKQYFHDEDKENLKQLTIQFMEKYGSTK